MPRNVRVPILCLLLGSCSGVSMIVRDGRRDLYREGFDRRIEEIRRHYQEGRRDRALEDLRALSADQEATPSERAMAENLMGVVHFAGGGLRRALARFEASLATPHPDRRLRARASLNLASVLYKLGRNRRAHDALAGQRDGDLGPDDHGKYWRLRHELARGLGEDEDAARSLVHYFRRVPTIQDLRADPLFEELSVAFLGLDGDAKDGLLDEFAGWGGPDHGPVAGYLGFQEAERLYYGGERGDARDLLERLRRRHAADGEVARLVDGFLFRLENASKMEPGLVGVVLPLTGPRAAFGKRALLGIDSALARANRGAPPGERVRLVIRDSRASGAVGAMRVRELVERHRVSAVIGGLFPAAAAKQYLEARRSGVLFLSLAPVHVPKERKNHLLLELSGSVESQVGRLFSKGALDRFGRRAAIAYPRGDRGRAYLDEFWRRASLAGVTVTGVVSFDEGETDYREPARRLLGLAFNRERGEEYELLDEIRSLEGRRSGRRAQVLKPRIDFDWVFVPSLPGEALRFIPALSYFDAVGLTVVGVPSWRTPSVVRESGKLGTLHIVGDDAGTGREGFVREFARAYGSRPGMVELRAHDAMAIAADLAGRGGASRDDLDRAVRSKGRLAGLTGRWTFDGGVWVKDMGVLRLADGKIGRAL